MKPITEENGSKMAWKEALSSSPVRLPWDCDHAPSGEKLARRAIQPSLGGEALVHYAQDWILNIEGISSFVHEQRFRMQSSDYSHLPYHKKGCM